MRIQFIKSDSIKVQLEDDQWKMISAPENIAAALKKANVIGLDIYTDCQLIGFAMLRNYSEDGWFLWDYAIDKHFQNKSYGQKVLLALIAYMKEHYAAKEISTTYLWGNDHARYIYEKVGFIQTDIVNEEDCHEVNMLYTIEK